MSRPRDICNAEHETAGRLCHRVVDNAVPTRSRRYRLFIFVVSMRNHLFTPGLMMGVGRSYFVRGFLLQRWSPDQCSPEEEGLEPSSVPCMLLEWFSYFHSPYTTPKRAIF